MSATDRLRALLTERGVGWEDMSALGFLATLWHGVDAACTALEGADDIPHGKVSVQACLTPEQAIAATLGVTDATGGRRDGAGMCEDMSGGDPCLFVCSCCGAMFDHPEDERVRYCPNCGRRAIE